MNSGNYKNPLLYRSALGANMYTYLKFGLPRVFPPSRGPRDGSSGYDSSDDGSPYLHRQGRNYLRSRSDPDFRNQPLHRPYSGVSRHMSCDITTFTSSFSSHSSSHIILKNLLFSLFDLSPSSPLSYDLYSAK